MLIPLSPPQAALRYLMLEAATQGGLQRDIDKVMAALETMTESDDDGEEQAAGKDAPTGATLLSLLPDPATASGIPAVVYFGEGVLPPSSATYAKIWTGMSYLRVSSLCCFRGSVHMWSASLTPPPLAEVFEVLEEKAEGEQKFPVTFLLVLTTITTSMVLLYIHYLYQRYKPKGVMLGADRAGTGGGAGYRSVSLIGSTHSIVNGGMDDMWNEDGSPRSTDTDTGSADSRSPPITRHFNPLHSIKESSAVKKTKKKKSGAAAAARAGAVTGAGARTKGRGIEMRTLVSQADDDIDALYMEEEVVFTGEGKL